MRDRALRMELRVSRPDWCRRLGGTTSLGKLNSIMDILYSGKVDGFCIISSDSDFTRLAIRKAIYGFPENWLPDIYLLQTDYGTIRIRDTKGNKPVCSCPSFVKASHRGRHRPRCLTLVDLASWVIAHLGGKAASPWLACQSDCRGSALHAG